MGAGRRGPDPGSNLASSLHQFLDVVVVGAGISGLVTAQALLTEHAAEAPRMAVTEARDSVGGNITTRAGNGFRWEEGPNSFQPNDAMLKAAVDAGVAGDLVLGDPTAPRFVFWGGRLRPTPSGPDAVTFDLMTIPGKLRAGLGALGLWKAPMPEQEESVEQFVRRNLGAEVFERLIEPFCSGVYAGDPAKLSMKAAFGKVYDLEVKGGSIVGGVLALLRERKTNPPPPRDPSLPPKPAGQTVGSFREGLATLPAAIAAKLGDRVRLQWSLEGVAPVDGGYALTYATPDGPRTLKARAVALTLPAHAAAPLVAAAAPAAATALASFDYPPVAAVTLAYPETSIRADRRAPDGTLPGFGQLHPRSQGITTLGTIYSSSLFPGRAPAGMVEVLCYIGGATNRGIVDQGDDAIVAQCDADLRAMLVSPDAPPARKIGVRVWPRAIPQFNVGHGATLDAARGALDGAGWGGVRLGGNYVAGVALGKCVEYGFTFAAEVAAVAAAARARAV